MCVFVFLEVCILYVYKQNNSFQYKDVIVCSMCVVW